MRNEEVLSSTGSSRQLGMVPAGVAFAQQDANVRYLGYRQHSPSTSSLRGEVAQSSVYEAANPHTIGGRGL